ncbi:MAG: LptA/OstA family protein, partial [Kiloniellales bacterium]
IAHYREKPRGGTEIWRLDADGNVRVASPSETAYGDRGVYDIDRGILVLKGRRLRLESTDGQVTARDSLEYWEGRRMAVARGAAYAREGQNQIWADILSVYLHEDAQGKTVMQRVEAFDKVRIETPQDVVVGDLGLYNLDSRTAILCRGVTIVRGDDRLSGQVAEVNLATGRARLRPGRCAFTVK